METARHPLVDYPEDHKIDYLSIVASIASADGRVTENEITRLRQYCETIGIGGMGAGLILTAVEDASVIDIQAVVERLSQTDLKFTLLCDMLFMAYADGLVSPAEQQEIAAIAKKLGARPAQLDAMSAYVAAALSAERAETLTAADWDDISRQTTQALTDAGIPINAVAIAGCRCGYAGIQWLYTHL